ncbi:MAG: hypothetical protein RLZZ611_2337 [Cyanobacteriota bacterium]|jgi:hypothetical protein
MQPTEDIALRAAPSGRAACQRARHQPQPVNTSLPSVLLLSMR